MNLTERVTVSCSDDRVPMQYTYDLASTCIAIAIHNMHVRTVIVYISNVNFHGFINFRPTKKLELFYAHACTNDHITCIYAQARVIIVNYSKNSSQQSVIVCGRNYVGSTYYFFSSQLKKNGGHTCTGWKRYRGVSRTSLA